MITYKTLFLAILSICSVNAGTGFGQELDSLPAMIAREPFSHSWRLPASLPLPRVESLLQRFYEQLDSKGFRYFGDVNDANHGHLLFVVDSGVTGGKLKPVAILYHTQEQAYAAHWQPNGNKRYDYLNTGARNWLQWLDDDAERDGQRIENARLYLNEAQKDPQRFFHDEAPRENEHYTLHSKNLDLTKLGLALVGELQFDFDEITCGIAPYERIYERGPLHVQKADGSEMCLALKTQSPFLQR